MGEKTQIDISQCSFDEFITFLFDRDVPAKTQKWNPWYWKVEVTFDPRSVCTFYVRLFRQPGFLMKRFSKAQLEQGFWAIPWPVLASYPRALYSFAFHRGVTGLAL
jgi:hypothetical protein